MIVDSTIKDTQNNAMRRRFNIRSSNAYAVEYVLDGLTNGGIMAINDERVLNETIAEKIARAEFLDNGYTNQVVEFTTDFTDLQINDIISIYAPTYRIPRELNKDRFIVKRVEHIFQDGFIKSRIKAVRYDL